MATVLFCGECWSWASGNDPPAVLFKLKRLSPRGSAPSSELPGEELLRGLRRRWKDLAAIGRQTSRMSVVSFASARWANHPSYFPVEMFWSLAKGGKADPNWLRHHPPCSWLAPGIGSSVGRKGSLQELVWQALSFPTIPLPKHLRASVSPRGLEAHVLGRVGP